MKHTIWFGVAWSLWCGALVGCSLFDSYSEEERERYYNYQLLKAYSIHADRLQGYEAYANESLDSLYKAIHDPYTRYTPPPKADSTKDDGESTPKNLSFGFERVLNETRDTLVVTEVYPISPAHDAGLHRGDKLVDGFSCGDISIDMVSCLGYILTGEDAKHFLTDDKFQQNLRLSVLRGGERIPLPEMRKTEVRRPTVFLTDWECPIIRVTEFAPGTNHPQGTAAEFEVVLAQIQGAGVAILDLRGNLGGSIAHCDRMAADLLPADTTMLVDIAHFYNSQKKRTEVKAKPSKTHATNGPGMGIRWIVLVNRATASCSERMVAALKHIRPETVILGETTYGKGIGQTRSYTYAGGYATITSLVSYRPDGTTWHRSGIVPDVAVDPKSEEIYRVALGYVDGGGRLGGGVKKRTVRRKVEVQEAQGGREGAWEEVPFVEFY